MTYLKCHRVLIPSGESSGQGNCPKDIQLAGHRHSGMLSSSPNARCSPLAGKWTELEITMFIAVSEGYHTVSLLYGIGERDKGGRGKVSGEGRIQVEVY